MGRQIINVGANQNDGTGEGLRDAMVKINQNFAELYERTGSDTASPIDITDNTISSVNNMVLKSNNSGSIYIESPLVANSNVTVNGYRLGINTLVPSYDLDIIGNARVSGNSILGDDIFSDIVMLNATVSNSIIPTINNQFDIGSNSNRYKDLYISNIGYIGTLQTSNSAITGGTINNTVIGAASPSDGTFQNITVLGDSFIGDLLLRSNQINSKNIDSDIQINPLGSGKVFISTKLVLGVNPYESLNSIIKANGNADDFVQIAMQNLNSGTSASSDFCINSDIGTDDDYFINIGINSSNYSNPVDFSLHPPLSGYLFVESGSLVIGTNSENDIVLHVNGANIENEVLRIKGDTGNAIFHDGLSVVSDSGERLQVKGDASASGYFEASSLRGGVIRSDLIDDIELTTPMRNVYSYNPQISNCSVKLPDPTENPGVASVFLNRSLSETYDIIGFDSTILYSLTAGNSVTLISDSVEWLVMA